MVQGVFSLLEVRTEQVKNIADGNFASWPEGASYGYFAGGMPPNTGTSTIFRLDFLTETTSTPATPLGRETNEFDGFSSSLYGYFGGGDTPAAPSSSNIDRLEFSTDTVSNPGNYLSPARQALSETSNNYYGYFGGGNNAGTRVNTISRFDFSNETVSNPGKNLLSVLDYSAGTSSNSYGYFSGGVTTSTVTVNTITRLDFSSETVSNPNNNLPAVRQSSAASKSNSYGYFGGGGPDSGSQINTITRLDFSNETVSNPNNNLSSQRQSLAAISSASCGYFGGGILPGGANTTDIITKLNFINETVSDISTLPLTRNALAAVSGTFLSKDTKTTGYILKLNDTYRIDFSNNTISNGYSPAYEINTNNIQRGAGVSNSYYGYLAGGADQDDISKTITALSSFYRLDFYSSLVTDLTSTKGILAGGFASAQNSSYGYFAGGFANPSGMNTLFSKMTRLEFSTETIINNSSAKLPSARSRHAGSSSSSYGYFAGGDTQTPAESAPNPLSTINRLDFSSETVSIISNLPSSRVDMESVSSNLYGYFVGGETPLPSPTVLNTVSRLDFSNETVSNPGKNLTGLPSAGGISERSRLTGTSSDYYGYFLGGVDENTLTRPTYTMLDLSTETFTNLPVPAPVTINISSGVGLSNSN